LLQKYIVGKNNPSLLEIGCADGVIIRAIEEKCGNTFKGILGIDISSEMVKAAVEKNVKENVSFRERKDYINTPQDVIIEIGVINYASLDDELIFISSQLKKDGIAIISLAGIGSLWDKQRKKDTGFNNFFSYKEYEEAIQSQFTIIDIVPVGLQIPLIWRIPSIALPLQSLKEKILRHLAPNLFHEKIYVLKALSTSQV
jgi:SAM-dependent methyltransferase